METVSGLQRIAKLQNTARDLKERASKAADPKERERLFKEAYDKEIEANGHSKWAKRLESGAWQGLFGGSGIGGGVGMGLGAIVGTLVGGIGTLITLPLGGLIGAGVGAAHGPWIKVGDQMKRWEDASPEQVLKALEQEQNAGPPPPSELQEKTMENPRKKPRKLEIRSQKAAESHAVEPPRTEQHGKLQEP